MLETFQGIVNACLPMLQAIAKTCYILLNVWIKKHLFTGKPDSALTSGDNEEPECLNPVDPDPTKTSVSSRLFRRLYDHNYLPTTTHLGSSGLELEVTRVSNDRNDVEALRSYSGVAKAP